MYRSASTAIAIFAFIATPAAAHSWIEQLMVVNPSNYQMVGNPGYARNNTMRTAPGFSDLLMVHILPGQGQPAIEERDVPSQTEIQGIQSSDPMCKKTQQTQYQSNGSPRLQAAAGDIIALRYEENGHVTLPANQPGKPNNRGNVYIYGTTQPQPDDKFLDIFGVWNGDGTGGDKRGKLLATQPFDDGQCYQVNGGSISADRQKQFPHAASTLMGTDLWCQNNIKVPLDAPSGKPYTLYWVWSWPTAPGADPNLPKGKAEIYTTCMDIDITSAKSSRDLQERQAPASSGTNLNNMAIPQYVKELAAAPPASSPVASSSPAPAQPATAAPAAASPANSPSAAQSMAKPVTVTVTVGTPIQNSATPAPATSANTVTQAQAPAAQASSPATAQSSTNAMPPTSLNIAPPAMSATPGGNSTPATSATAPPSGNAASLPTFTGTASNVKPSTMMTAPSSAKTQSAGGGGGVGARSCPAKNCQQKRSRIFGAAAH